MSHSEQMCNTETIYQGRIITVTRDTVKLEDGSTSCREVVHHHGAAAVVPINQKGEVYLVRQYRYPMGQELWEIPAGKIDPGEEPLTAAIRELEEECGLTAEVIRELHPIYPSVGYDTEVIYIYLATELHRTEAHLDEGEFLDVKAFPIDKLVEMVMAGQLRDAKTVAGILKAKIILGEK